MRFGQNILSVGICVDETVPALEKALGAMGGHVFRSFDLQSACAAHHLTCPRHGEIPCSCQLVVLMVYASDGRQFSLTVYGSEDQSEIAITKADQDLIEQIKDSILHAFKTAIY
ncbi:MAG: hypothetical protein GTO14_12815 [Anaerolineales bacterium]|nr:hypothetical protein [Anaerolineales bacterium]